MDNFLIAFLLTLIAGLCTGIGSCIAFFAKHTLIETYDMNYRFSADFDWCIRIMKKARTLHNTHLTVIDYLDEGMTTRNQKASLKERFRIMCQHYGVMSTVAHHACFIIRAISKK